MWMLASSDAFSHRLSLRTMYDKGAGEQMHANGSDEICSPKLFRVW